MTAPPTLEKKSWRLSCYYYIHYGGVKFSVEAKYGVVGLKPLRWYYRVQTWNMIDGRPKKQDRQNASRTAWRSTSSAEYA